MKLLSVVLICAVLSACHGYRILGVFPFNGKSHFMMFEHLMKSLARKGHQVDVISTFPLKKPYPNYNDIIVLPFKRQFMNNLTYNEIDTLFRDSVVYAVASLAGNVVCEHLNNPEIQQFMQNPPKDPPYDVIIIEATVLLKLSVATKRLNKNCNRQVLELQIAPHLTVFGAHCYAILGDILKVPIIGASSAVLYPWIYDFIGNPDNFAFVPSNILSYSQDMNFWERMHNFLNIVSTKWEFNSLSSKQTDMMRKYVSSDAPDIRQLERKMSMILVNSHISINGIKDVTPAYIEIGGLHVQEEGVELPASLEKWMNESTHGFVYFSFGSMVKIESFPIKHVNIFYNSLGKIAPVRVLMKIAKSSELPPGLPKNVHVLPWIPQVKVLKHKNVKAFITHGGLMGTQEAIHYGVPMIGMPLFADQFINIANYMRHNIAIELELKTLTEEKMDNALNAILNDPKYRAAAQKLSQKFRDRPLSAEDTAVYWTEYIVRHGANALRSPAMNLTWWQIELLDVYAFLLIATLAVLYLIATAIPFMYNLATSPDSGSRKKKVS
ncbi:UDP-glucuronosyltransferase 2B4 [Melipona quadrifasciata]|uniref:UDP-glucuronosyltransferase 2B4 n=1 Tax=Melipona quadrifasciata TaxID=166423 RepID=A0A0M8ZQK9_9HYME|nr:UDP-glucuronosyltransferase 2B4 [Melipona quadrifasciata]